MPPANSNSLLQPDPQLPLRHLDLLHPVGEGLPETPVAAELLYQVDVFQVAEPGVGQGDAPDADPLQASAGRLHSLCQARRGVEDEGPATFALFEQPQFRQFEQVGTGGLGGDFV